MKLCLVASRNGHGHARRLLHLGIGLRLIGSHVTILCGKSSFSLIKRECSDLGMNDIVIEEIEAEYDLGLDGPYCVSTEEELSIKTKHKLFRKFALFDHVIGDNVLWPAEFANSFIFHGHFLWLDYYNLHNPNKRQYLKKQKIKDLSNLDLTKKFFLNGIFEIKSQFVKAERVKYMPLMQYYSIPKAESSFTDGINSTVWLAIGLTNSTSKHLLSFLADTAQSMGINIQMKETFNLNSSLKPSVVIGRPGLGTIRDIMSYGVDFIPIDYVSDPELSHNVEVLSDNRLIRLGGSLEDRILQSINLPLSMEIKSFWNANSVTVSEYASLCLAEL